MTDVRLKPIRAVDRALITKLAAPYYEEVAADLGIDANLAIERQFADTSRRNWINFSKQDLADFAFTYEGEPDCWEIAEFCILPQHRRKGIGRRAVQLLLTNSPSRDTWGPRDRCSFS